LPKDTKAAGIASLPDKDIQTMVNTILIKLKKETDTATTLSDCTLLGTKTIQLPKWFLDLKGHKYPMSQKDADGSQEDLYDGLFYRYTEAYPQLKSFEKEHDLNREILNVVINEHPELLSTDVAELFNQLTCVSS